MESLCVITPRELREVLGSVIDEKLTMILGSQNEKKDSEKLFTRKEVASYLKISLPTLRDYTKNGLIAATKLGTRVRYRQENIDKFLVDRTMKCNQGLSKRKVAA